MFEWLGKDVPEATWSEINQVYLEYFKCITHSAIDRPVNPVVYINVPSIPVDGKEFGIDFTPITFVSSYFIHTHKGNGPT